MKPCRTNRKRIAWLAVDELDAKAAAALRDHFSVCEGCRSYWEELSNVAAALGATASQSSNVKASELFHRRVMDELRAIESGSVLDSAAAWVGGNWRVASAALVLLVGTFVAVLALRHPVQERAPANVQAVSPRDSDGELAPTVANYQMVANQSLEKLDELLTLQGNKPLPAVPAYAISDLEMARPAF